MSILTHLPPSLTCVRRTLLLAFLDERCKGTTRLVQEYILQSVGPWIHMRSDIHAAPHRAYPLGSAQGMNSIHYYRQAEVNLMIMMIQNEAYIFLGGCLGDLSLTLWFLPVL